MKATPTRLTLGAAVLAMLAIGVLQAQNATRPATQPRGHAHDHAGHDHDHAHGHAHARPHAQAFQGIDRAVAVLMPTEGNDTRGVVYFEEQPDGRTTISYRVEGLDPGGDHGFHVHEYGDLTAPDGTSLGGHYNPEGHPHDLPDTHPRHAGDLGNITANDEGVAEGSITVDNLTVAGPKNPVLGRGMVVHAQPDTGEGETGEAGARIAVGTVGVAQPPSE